MLKEYQIANFKAFAGPVVVPIRPITLIFGANSSGKSSILQSILMLKQTIDEGESRETALLSKGNLVDLGSYREFVHRHETERPFSIKVTMQKPKDIDEPFPSEKYLSNIRDYNSCLEKLNKSVDFESFGMCITFSYEQNSGTAVSKIELFLGDDPAPIVTYEHEPPDKSQEEYVHRIYKEAPRSFLKIKTLDENHKFWRSYYKNVDREPSKISIAGDHLDKLGPETREIVERIIRDQSQLGSFNEDFLLLRNFLPDSLNGIDVQYIMFDNDHGEAGNNVSLFTLSVSYLLRQFLDNVIHLGPLRHYPERYFMFSGMRTQYVGKTGMFVPDILINDKEILSRVNEQFDRLKLGYELKVSPLSDQASQIQDLYAIRLCEKETRVHVGITDVGFGISQVLPDIVQSMISREKTLLIEQPELHLHPALQAELGDVFIDSALGEGKNRFLIETHSEHLLLRVMRRMRETSNDELPEGVPQVTPKDVCVLFVEPDGSRSIVREMPLNENGELVKAWPGGFFEEGLREVF